jgi:hypothetical protein
MESKARANTLDSDHKSVVYRREEFSLIASPFANVMAWSTGKLKEVDFGLLWIESVLKIRKALNLFPFARSPCEV